MAVRRNLARRQSDGFRSAGLRQSIVIAESISAEMDRDAALQVGEREGCLPIAAVRGPNQGEQGFIARYGQHRSVAEHPAGRGKISGKHPYLTNKRL